MHQSSLNSHKNEGHSPFFLPPIMRSSVGQCRNIRFRQLYASPMIITSAYANSAYQAQMLQKAVSDQDIHVYCLLTDISIQNTVKVKTFTRTPKNQIWAPPNDMDGQVHWSKKGQGPRYFYLSDQK